MSSFLILGIGIKKLLSNAQTLLHSHISFNKSSKKTKFHHLLYSSKKSLLTLSKKLLEVNIFVTFEKLTQ
ncbi:MAG: hypothetical protein U9Q66_01820 [Patescibacteria group bacterium]|nr:hypothetical protein [Patescibacteria group bacterium]